MRPKDAPESDHTLVGRSGVTKLRQDEMGTVVQRAPVRADAASYIVSKKDPSVKSLPVLPIPRNSNDHNFVHDPLRLRGVLEIVLVIVHVALR